MLKNAFVTTVDQMAEQILRTCHSFVIYARDFSSALCDVRGDTIMQGSQDIAVHVGTLHTTAKSIIEAFGDDMRPEDIYAMNDPYLGGTHFNDVRIVKPIFHDGEVIAFALSERPLGRRRRQRPRLLRRATPRSTSREGLRVPPIRIWDEGRYRGDIVQMIVSNTRAPSDAEGDLHAQAEATRVAEREILRLIDKYGRDTVMTALLARCRTTSSA